MKSCLAILFFLSGISVKAQTKIKCIMPPDSNGIPGAVVHVYKAGAVVYSSVTDEQGEIRHNLNAPYIIKVVCLGCNEHSDTITEDSPAITVAMSENLRQLEDIVVTTQYNPTSTDNSTYKIKVIDSKKIEELAAVNLKDALSNELNIRFSQDNATGASNMSLQGLSGQNIKVLIDGVPMIGRQDGNLDLSQINMNNVERIEIVEGPLSVNYGTDALAGVINIITKRPKKNKLEAGVQSYYETSNTYNANAFISLHKKRHGFKLSGGRNYFNGWSPEETSYFLPQKTLADTNRRKSWKPREQYFGTINYRYNNDKTELIYQSSMFDELILSRGFPVAPYYETALDDYFKTFRFDNFLNTNFKLKNHKSFNNILACNFYERRKNTWFKDLTNLEETLSADAGMHDTSRFKLLMMRGSFISSKPFNTYKDSIKETNRFNYELGYDLNYESAFGKRIEDSQKYIADLAGYASAEIQPVHHFIIRPGLRYAFNTIYTAPATPSLHLKYNTASWIFRASYARGFRAPTLKELYFDFVDINHNITGNIHLKAETSDNYTASWKYKKQKKKTQFAVEQSAFYNTITNLITLGTVSGSQYSYINIGKFISLGTALNCSAEINDINLSAGISYIGRYNQLSEEYTAVTKFSYTPEARASLQYEIKKLKSSINVFYKYTGRLSGVGLNSNNETYATYISAYHMLDLNISMRLFKKKFIVSPGIKNMFNVTNVTANYGGDGAHSSGSISSPVAMGRTYFLKLDYVFSK